MITSDAPGHILDKLRRLAGSNPEGSRLTEAERLHLIYMLTSMGGAAQGQLSNAYAVYRELRDQLAARGLPDEAMTEIYQAHQFSKPVELADAIAVHPSLENRNPPGCYLD